MSHDNGNGPGGAGEEAPLSAAERKMQERVARHDANRERGEIAADMAAFAELVQNLPEGLNLDLRGIAIKYEEIAMVVARRAAGRCWHRFEHAGLDEVAMQLSIFMIFKYANDRMGSGARAAIAAEIEPLFRQYQVETAPGQIEILSYNILSEAARETAETAFKEHARRLQVPELAIARIYPPRRINSVEAFLEMLDNDMLFPPDRTQAASPSPPGSPPRPPSGSPSGGSKIIPLPR